MKHLLDLKAKIISKDIFRSLVLIFHSHLSTPIGNYFYLFLVYPYVSFCKNKQVNAFIFKVRFIKV